MPLNMSSCRCGADASKNEAGMIGNFLLCDQSHRDVRAGNGSVIPPILFNNETGIGPILILHTRLCCLSAVNMFFASCGCDRSPLSTHMHQRMPCIERLSGRYKEMVVEYFKKDIVREFADNCPPASVELVCVIRVHHPSQYHWKPKRLRLADW